MHYILYIILHACTLNGGIGLHLLFPLIQEMNCLHLLCSCTRMNVFHYVISMVVQWSSCADPEDSSLFLCHLVWLSSSCVSFDDGPCHAKRVHPIVLGAQDIDSEPSTCVDLLICRKALYCSIWGTRGSLETLGEEHEWSECTMHACMVLMQVKMGA